MKIKDILVNIMALIFIIPEAIYTIIRQGIGDLLKRLR